LNVNDSWRIAHLLAVKYATASSAQSEIRMAIPRFMFVLGGGRASLMLLGVRSCTRIASERGQVRFLAGSWHWLRSWVPGQSQEAGAELCR